MIWIILSSVLLIVSLILLYIAHNIKIEKQTEQQRVIQKEQIELNALIDNKIKVNEELQQLYNAYEKADLKLNRKIEEYDKYCISEKKKIEEQLEVFKTNCNLMAEEYQDKYDVLVSDLNDKYNKQKIALEEQIKVSQQELDKLRESLRAGAEASARARALKEEQEFYKLHVDPADLQDILLLEGMKLKLHDPVILSKLIWSQYFLSEANALGRRVVGEGKVCGIYKITNVNSDQCYIGQSVDIADRWKAHIKCGLGIDASSTNNLYNAMQRIGVWNFTFEVIEECPKDQLNEKEKQWIDFYNSAELGYNKTKGNN